MDGDFDGGVRDGLRHRGGHIVLRRADQRAHVAPEHVKDRHLVLRELLPDLIKGGRVHVPVTKRVELEAGKRAVGVHSARVAKELRHELDGRLQLLGLCLVAAQHLGPLLPSTPVEEAAGEVCQRAGDDARAAVLAIIQKHDGARALAVGVPLPAHALVCRADFLRAVGKVALPVLANKLGHPIQLPLLINLRLARRLAAAQAGTARCLHL
mmetsp:Transcript_68059/g.164572  ORF Transcript_68059/g.164572 Transcript_68059/m.164572 type:complete len:211 (-) Transcript_68059:177-809(-)